MTKSPNVPREQRSFADPVKLSIDDAAQVNDRRDATTGVQSTRPGDVAVNLSEQGRYGNLKHNLTNHWKVEER